MSRIYDLCFRHGEESRANKLLDQKMEAFKWIQESHLDIPFGFSLTLEKASAALLGINAYKAPSDKLSVMQDVIQLVVELIQLMSPGNLVNQDVLLPTLILVIIRASPQHLISNIKYVFLIKVCLKIFEPSRVRSGQGAILFD